MVYFVRRLGKFESGVGNLGRIALGVLRFGTESLGARPNGAQRLRRSAYAAMEGRCRPFHFANHRAEIEFKQIDRLANRRSVAGICGFHGGLQWARGRWHRHVAQRGYFFKDREHSPTSWPQRWLMRG